MIVSMSFAALRATRFRQYAVRFALGGLATVATGLITQHFGPVLGGLFLAFPAIFPASATLIATRESTKKHEKGLHGEVRGRRVAALDAAGTVLGAFALAAFAATTWLALPTHRPALVLLGAGAVWLLLSVALWWLRKRHWLTLAGRV
jgi:Protein of unknown function (DUF3147)